MIKKLLQVLALSDFAIRFSLFSVLSLTPAMAAINILTDGSSLEPGEYTLRATWTSTVAVMESVPESVFPYYAMNSSYDPWSFSTTRSVTQVVEHTSEWGCQLDPDRPCGLKSWEGLLESSHRITPMEFYNNPRQDWPVLVNLLGRDRHPMTASRTVSAWEWKNACVDDPNAVKSIMLVRVRTLSALRYRGLTY